MTAIYPQTFHSSKVRSDEEFRGFAKGKGREIFNPAKYLLASPAPSCPAFPQNSPQKSALSVVAVHYFVPSELNPNINFCLQTPRTTSFLPLPSYMFTLQGERRTRMAYTFSCKPKTSLLWLMGGSLSSQIHQLFLLIPNKAKKIFLSLIRSATQFGTNTKFNNQTCNIFFRFQIVQQHATTSAA